MLRVFVALALSGAVSGAPASPPAPTPEAVRAAVAKLSPGLQMQEPHGSPVDGLYQTLLDGTSGYVTADGRYFIVGDMFEVASRRNLSEESRKSLRLDAVARLSDKNTILFAPAKPKHWITIFTDVDCPFCQKLQADIDELNQLGIAVRYLAYPRSGPGTESWAKMEAVWCAKDRRDAMLRATRGEAMQKPADCNAPSVADQYALGQTLGIQGTPMIILEDGSIIGGYMPAALLAKKLEGDVVDKTVAR